MTRSSSGGAEAERPTDAAIAVRFVGHATALIDVGSTRVLTDPFLGSRLGPLQRHGPLPDPAELEADVVVVSHGHPDHFDLRSLERLPGRPILVVPRGLGHRCLRLGGAHGAHEVVELGVGETVAIGGLAIQAVPARHWISPGAPRAQPLGYVLDAGPRVYFAGDTGPDPGLPASVGTVDLALLPVWTWGPHLGPGHLGPRSAAEVTRDLGAPAVVPIHWGTLYPRHLHRVWQRPLMEPGDRFAAYAANLAPGADVRVMRPGDATTIGMPSRRGRGP